MFFYLPNDDIILTDFFFDRKDDKFSIISGYTTFGDNGITKDLSIDFINTNLDVMQYQISPLTARVAFFKKRYFELFKEKEKQDCIKFDIPYIINITTVYDNCDKFSKNQYKIIGFKNKFLVIESITKDGYFTEIERLEGYELVERSRVQERLNELKEKEEWVQKLRRGGIL